MSNIIPKIIGVSGYARCGKDTFVRVASKILNKNGYNTQKLSFAFGLKDDLDGWLLEKYRISAWTENPEEKKLIRPFMLAHGQGKRYQTEGKYWVDKVNIQIEKKLIRGELTDRDVIFISDVRFPNEQKWLHESWNGWLVHIKQFTMKRWHPTVSEKTMNNFNDELVESMFSPITYSVFCEAPNDEEAKNDPLVREKSDYQLELENVIEREKRLTGNIITVEQLEDNMYLNEEITLCLTQCPFLTIPKQ